MTKIKICGLFRPCDIDYVNAARPDWCGFIVNFPRSRRNRTPDQVRTLRERLDPAVVPVGVFVDRPAEEAAGLLNDGTISAAQLHGQEDEDYVLAVFRGGQWLELDMADLSSPYIVKNVVRWLPWMPPEEVMDG